MAGTSGCDRAELGCAGLLPDIADGACGGKASLRVARGPDVDVRRLTHRFTWRAQCRRVAGGKLPIDSPIGRGRGVARAGTESPPTAITCPDCGWAMVKRRNRRTGEAFFGCSRFPACRGTRRIDDSLAAFQGTEHPTPQRAGPRRGPRPARARIRLSSGNREPRGAGDYAELIVARLVGRNLTGAQGFVVQIAGMILLAVVAYWFFASGTIAQIATLLANWYSSNAMHPFTVTPSPS